MSLAVSIDEFVGLGLAEQEARALIARLESLPADLSPAETWDAVTNSILYPKHPFPIHKLLFDHVYGRDRDSAAGPPPAWIPNESTILASNVHRMCQRQGVESMAELFDWSVRERPSFWAAMIEELGIRFQQPPESIVDLTKNGIESPDWLPGARLNIADSCFTADPSTPAVVFQTEGGKLNSASYDQLNRLSNRVANGIDQAGFEPGDAVAICMPMSLEAVAAYLGIVKAGCAVVSIADSFAPDEIATRLRIANARATVTQDVLVRAGKTLPMYEKVAAAAVGSVIVVDTGAGVSLGAADLAWVDFLGRDESYHSRACSPGDPINILFSSGTTGEPKAIPWTHTTPIKCATDGHLHHDIQPGDVVAWPTNIGWMMGPWLIFATLVNRGTMALYYGAPNSREFCEFVQNAGVRMLGVVPSLVKAWRAKADIDGLDWGTIKCFSSTGEASNAEDMLYLMSRAGYRPVVEYCGGTEIGGGYVTGSVVQPASPATFSTPAFGLDFHILDEDGKPADNGELFLVPPSIGLSNTLLNRDHHEVYYADTPAGPSGELLRRHGDQMEAMGGGYFRAHGRADDTMNLGGIKVSSAEIERTVNQLDGVVETAAIAVTPVGGGPSQLVIYTVAEANTKLDSSTLVGAMQRKISKALNPLFRVHDAVLIETLPRTASNKVMRRVLRDQYSNSSRA